MSQMRCWTVTDAVMLSAETAVGDYPVETIQAMERVCLQAEKELRKMRSIIVFCKQVYPH
ncbi:MAG: hypothetical protein WDM70_09535 [Nitrosomonadales bacterium]